MVFRKDPTKFFNQNFKELYAMVASVCNQYGVKCVDDIFGKVSYRILYTKALSRYKKNLSRYKKASGTKISSYIFPLIRNIVRVFIYEGAEIVSRRSTCHAASGAFVDQSNFNEERLDCDYKSIIYRNLISDQVDGLHFDLECFKDFIEEECRDSSFSLGRRKDPKVRTFGLKLSDVYRLLQKGYTSDEIASKYGVSNTFISLVKKDIADAMVKFGIRYNNYQKKLNTKKYEDFDFEETPYVRYSEHHEMVTR